MTSPDAGASWSEPIEPPSARGFPVGPVKNKAIVLADGTWLAPPSLETESAWDSADCGRSWSEAYPTDLPSELSYPAVVAVGDRLLVTYTWRRERICFCEIPGLYPTSAYARSNSAFRYPIP